MDCKGVSDPISGDSNFLSSGEVVRGNPFFRIFLNFFKFIGRWNGIPIILPLRVCLGFEGKGFWRAKRELSKLLKIKMWLEVTVFSNVIAS
jgi:hypothetical protein